MVKLLKPGRVVIVTAGRFAGKKGLVVQTSEGTKDKPFGHAIVVGVKLPPRKVHKKMDKKRIEKRCKVKCFAKPINYNHLMPTRYSVATDFDMASLTEKVISTKKEYDDKKKTIFMKSSVSGDDKNAPLSGATAVPSTTELCDLRRQLRKSMSSILQEKFMNPVNEKTKKVSKDVLFLRKKLRF